MKLLPPTWRSSLKRISNRREEHGFTLVELLVTLGLFLVVGGAAFALLSQDMPVYKTQQNLTKLNLGLRNATTQLELDIANAGAGVNQGGSVIGFPTGATIVNRSPAAGESCYDPTTHSYGANCFDTLNILIAASGVPVLHPDYPCNNEMHTANTTFLVKPYPGPPAHTAATDAAFFHTGDQVLMLTGDGSHMTTFVLTANGATSGTDVQLSHGATNSDGTNSSTTNDPLEITTHGTSNVDRLTDSFCQNDWIINLTPITYYVDASDSTNPKLMRSQSGTASVVSEQVIAFKVGATIWNGTSSTDSAAYNYDASTYNNSTKPYDFTLVRSIGITLIGRTPPNFDSAYNYVNQFDQGPYDIQGVSIVVNPRNLTMND